MKRYDWRIMTVGGDAATAGVFDLVFEGRRGARGCGFERESYVCRLSKVDFGCRIVRGIDTKIQSSTQNSKKQTQSFI